MTLLFLFLVTALLFPSVASAEETTIWSFRGGNIPGSWDVVNLKPYPEATPEGLRIAAEDGGQLTRVTDLAHDVDAMTITFLNPQPSEATLLWHVRGSPKGELVQLPFQIFGRSDREIIALNTSRFAQWDPRTDRLGFAFPPGTHLIIEEIAFTRWNVFEKAWEMAKSFWVFDTFRPYSINFLWGPRFARHPIESMQLFQAIPPMGWSSHRGFFLLIALAAIAAALAGAGNFTLFGRKPLTLFVLLCAALWIFYDARMGLEFMSYAVTDYRDYVAKPPLEKRFRERHDFHAFVAGARPFLEDRRKYIFLASYRWPFFGTIRYETFPIMPTDPEQGIQGVDTWVIYDRPEITVGEQGELRIGKDPVSLPGRILYQYNDSSFVFRTGA